MSARPENEPVLSVLDEIIAFGRQAAKDYPEARAGVEKLRRCEAARTKLVDLIEAARYLQFAWRDGGVFPRDYAAKRLEGALARATAEGGGAASAPTHIPGANPPIPTPERIAACVLACEGIPTEQLEAMNKCGRGLLAAAYDVCSGLWESFGEDLINDDPIDGCDAVEALCLVAGEIAEVTAWARVNGEPT